MDSVLLYGPVVGTGAAPAQVSPEVAQHVENGLKSRGAAPPPVYRRKKAPPHQSARLIITVAIAAFALFIRRCVASLAKSRAAASRRSLADGDDDFQQCVGPSFPSRHKPAVASSGMDPVMYQRLRNVLLLQERAIGSIWRAFPRLISPDVVKFLNVVVVYYTFEQTLLSAFLPDQLERLRRDAAAQLLSLARIPEAVYCLNELQVTAGQSLLFGWEGVKKAAECGPLPDTQGQIDEVKKEVHRKQEFAVRGKH
ncbi:LOW QUALITY PROTEIN: uncharacterized protein EMH_0031640 [Eimeria mitis]|uniref:Uncharacterized protein n=1 Tax=Eimeria mitis TaxID=44415 RepID=U6JPN5_9EIME|nr:LOW QUALITY PROTEIN: uncharacterized protein EMH_0031640 [Eimeria mitis]CDJ27414.1 hypothetical protein, conserved [Eimeria mitis]